MAHGTPLPGKILLLCVVGASSLDGIALCGREPLPSRIGQTSAGLPMVQLFGALDRDGSSRIAGHGVLGTCWPGAGLGRDAWGRCDRRACAGIAQVDVLGKAVRRGVVYGGAVS